MPGDATGQSAKPSLGPVGRWSALPTDNATARKIATAVAASTAPKMRTPPVRVTGARVRKSRLRWAGGGSDSPPKYERKPTGYAVDAVIAERIG